jgi:lipopolysaccharide biosynthesis regulator YciM
VVAAHYCCELGEAALARRDFEGARTQVAAARAHFRDLARATILSARIAAAAGEEGKALDEYARALAGSRTMQEAFEREARAALPHKASELTDRLNASPPPEDAAVPEPPRFRCSECGVASVTWHWRCPSCRNWDSLRGTFNRG